MKSLFLFFIREWPRYPKFISGGYDYDVYSPRLRRSFAQVFPYWRLSDLKRAAGRVLCVNVGELTTEKGTLLGGDGTSLGEAGCGFKMVHR